jgi:hypothetical protein
MKVLVFALYLAATSASSIQNGETGASLDLIDPINDLVLKIIHEIQSHMHDGIPSLGIPPLDPLNITKYNFDINESKVKVYGQLRNVTVLNLSSFNVTNISTHVFKRSVNVSIEIPRLTIEGLYWLKGKALSFFPISGKGPFELIPKDTRVMIFTTLTYHEGHFIVDQFDYKVTISDLRADFEGIYGSEIVSNVLNKILNGFGVSLFNRLEPLVHEDIRQVLIKEIDRLLRDIRVKLDGARGSVATLEDLIT